MHCIDFETKRLLKARPSQFGWMTLAAFIGFIVYFLLTSDLINISGVTPSLACAISAFSISIASNGIGKWTEENAFNPLVLGIVFLVPGSMGLRGAASFITVSTFFLP